MDARLKIIEGLTREINALESLRGLILWSRAPSEAGDAVQVALDKLNEAAVVAANWLEQRKDSEMLKELKTMLESYKSVKETVVGTNERLARLAQTCADCNAGLDAIFADFADDTAPEGEAAANGELGDGDEQGGGDGATVEGTAAPSGEV